MDPNRDNPILRFSTYLWGAGVFLTFGAAITAVVLINRQPGVTPEDVAAKLRYETKAKVDQAQLAELPPEKIAAAIPETAKKLAADKPRPAEIQATPATPTQVSPAPAAPAPAQTPASPATPAAPPTASIDPAVLEAGKAAFLICSACHGQNAEGSPNGPPLAGSEWVVGPVENLIRIQLRGLIGGITIQGKEHNFPGGMAPLAYQSDDQIAAVLTYVRNSFGNQASAVLPSQVAALRSEVGKPQLTVKDLVMP